MSDETALLTHQPCPDCGSSDALSVYADHTYCFSCETRTRISDDEGSDAASEGRKESGKDLDKVSYSALPARRLTEETCRFWSYGRRQSDNVHVAQYLDDNRKVVAQKLRTKDKKFSWKHRASFEGLYGQWLWRDGGKQVVVTEGELDALSVSQVQNNKWPVVSLPDGGGKNAVKAIKQALPWLSKFEKIILFFDNDEKGREAVEHVKKLLPVGKAWITYTPEGFKDANDLLKEGLGSKIVDCVWGSKQYRPDGLVSGDSIIKRLTSRPTVQSYSYPETMEILNHRTGGGIRLGELDVWTSGTGMGKTTLIKALQHHFLHNTEFNQALIHLEEPLEDTGDDLIAYEVGQRFTVDNPEFKNTSEYLDAAKRLFEAKDGNGSPRLHLYDAFGSLEDNSLFEIIRYAATAADCKLIWLDHLSILVSDLDGNDDERRKIDRIMHGLKDLTVELGVYIGLISHLRKPPGSKGPSFEEGAVPTLDDLRGSGGIKQLANGVLAISRNQQHENPEARNTSAITVLKCRKTGRTGPADFLKFSDETGRLERGTDPDLWGSDDFQDEQVSTDY